MNPDLLAELAASTDRSVQGLVVAWLAGELTDDEFVALAVAAIERAQAEGTAVADAAVAASVGAGAVGLLPRAGLAQRARRLVAALVGEVRDGPRITITWTPGTDPAKYVEQLRAELAEAGHDAGWYVSRHRTIAVLERARIDTRAEVLQAAQDANGDAVRTHGTPWTRALNSGACPLCQDLAGDVLPPAARMHTHKGCGCTQKPVNTKENR